MSGWGQPSHMAAQFLRKGDKLFPEKDGQAHPNGVVKEIRKTITVVLEDGREFTYTPAQNVYYASQD